MKAGDIEDQRHPPIAQDGRRRHAVEPLKIALQALDDDLLLTENFVHHETKAAALLGFHQHDQTARRVADGVVDAEQTVDIDEAHILAPRHDDVVLVGDALDVGALGTQAFDDVGQRQHEALLTDRNHHAVEHREREGQRQHEAGALARRRVDDDSPAETGDIAPDHVHADPAAGNGGNRIGGRKAGQEDQVVDLLVRHADTGGDKAALHRFLQNAGAVDAPSVILHFDDDAARAMPRRKVDGAAARLSDPLPLVGGFKPVVDRVADHVGQRIDQIFDDRLIDFGRFTGGRELDLLAGLRRHLADEARHAGEYRAHLLGADRHDAFLKLAGMPAQLLQTFHELLERTGRHVAQLLRDHRLGDDHFTDEVDQPVHLVQIHPDRVSAKSGPGAAARIAGGTGGRCRSGHFAAAPPVPDRRHRR